MKTAHQRIQEIYKVMKRGVEKAAEKHRLMGVPMVVWKDGKVVEFLPEPARGKKNDPRQKVWRAMLCLACVPLTTPFGPCSPAGIHRLNLFPPPPLARRLTQWRLKNTHR